MISCSPAPRGSFIQLFVGKKQPDGCPVNSLPEFIMMAPALDFLLLEFSSV